MSYRDPALLPPEVPRLKRRTLYRCPSGGGFGHGSTWTGDLMTGQGPTDHLCPCGAEYVEVVEDGHTYRVRWEMIGPFGTDWHEVTRDTTDRAAAVEQYRQLVEWERTGAEPVRSVRFLRSATEWVEVEP